MTQIARDQAYVLIEDKLDAIGQKFRVQRLIRGVLLWIACAAVATVLACFASHVLREGRWTTVIAVAWVAWLIGSALQWFVRPMLIRPKSVEVARLVERRVDGLHNGLTNSILLASAADLSASPYLPQIFEEILASTNTQPIDQAVKLKDLNPLALRLAMFLLPAVVLAVVFHTSFAHGWRQMFAPSRFVPQVGTMEIVEVQPGDLTLVAGQPLEITILAKGPQTPDAKLIFDGPVPQASLVGTVEDAQIRYSYRLDHVDQAMRYRVEVGSTQSQWYTVTVVHQVKLTGMDFKITPPLYTKQAQTTLNLKADEIDKMPITVPQGSTVDVGIGVDVATRGAMMQVGDTRQVEMEAADDNHHFHQAITIVADTTISIGLTEGQQIIAKLPENPLVIHCKVDDAPRIEMKWPNQDGVAIAPRQDLQIEATLSDDYTITAGHILLGIGDAPPTIVAEMPKEAFAAGAPTVGLKLPIHLTAEQCRHGQSIHVQVETTDNRDLSAQMKAAALDSKDGGGPQTTHSALLEIKFADPKQIADEQKDKADKLRARLMELLKTQQGLMAQAVGFKAGDNDTMGKINAGQTDLRNEMSDTADKFEFDEQTAIIKRTLQMLAANPAKEAIDLSAAIISEPVAKEQVHQNVLLRAKQQHIISTLESLLAMLNPSAEPTTQPSDKSHDPLLSKADAYKKMDEALKAFMKEQQRILDQTSSLAKKPVDNFDDNDKKKLDDLKMAQEKLDAFMQQKISDFSKNAEQDMSNPELLKELYEIQSEVTMAKDALKAKSAEIAVPAEENGLELAKEQSSNIEKWLANAPDRQQWTQEDPMAKTDTPMPELPKELEDMIGQLMEQQEDLMQDMEDANSNWQDSMDKGVGWDAADGPIADMSAKGVTGNVLPNNNEMQGRSGEGRSGKSQGEFVGDSAQGKGGRNTPTRLDPTPFEKGQIKDQSKDPTGGATGGGKLSGEGGQGLEGPVPPKIKQEMQRLAQKQAQLRNNAERLNLQYQLGRYDNFKLLQSIAIMRRVEADLDANRYQNAMHRRDVLIDSMETSHMLLGGQIHVQQDTTPTASGKTQQDINDAMKGTLPPAWSDALKEYYRKLSDQ